MATKKARSMGESVSADATAVAVQAAVMAKLGRNRPVNSFVPARPPAQSIGDDGVLYLNDRQYSADLPNSFLDVWHPDADLSTPRPVLVYFHGGGFIFGDKIAGDPLAANSEAGLKSLISGFLEDGFCVVCPEYAFAPEYRFPTQVRQADHVLAYLQQHADEYALDMDRVVLMGASAGANLVEITGLVISDAEYAASLGIRPSIRSGQVRGLVIDEAALTTRGVSDANMRALFQVWMGEEDPEEAGASRLLDVPSRIAGSYPPAFINSSNLEPWFVQSANDLRDALDRQGLRYEYFYRDQNVDCLEHGYVNRHATNAVAAECYRRMRTFALDVIR